MRVLGLDLETTGLDLQQDRIIELGLCLWETDHNLPLKMANILVAADRESNASAFESHGITKEMLDEFGHLRQIAFVALEDFLKHGVEYIIAHNGMNFDRPMLLAEARKESEALFKRLEAVQWVDTKTDLPWSKTPDSYKLKHLACDLGIINPFAHRALTDVLTMLQVMGHFPFKDILEYRALPNIVVRALVDYDNRDKAKLQKYSWEKLGEKTYQKMWVKQIKENKLDEEKQKCPFQVARIA